MKIFKRKDEKIETNENVVENNEELEIQTTFNESGIDELVEGGTIEHCEEAE